MVALPARVFDPLMYCPVMFRKRSLCTCLILTFAARVFNTFMYYSLVSSKTRLYTCCLIVAMAAMVFDSFMYHPLVFSKMFLCSCLIVALATSIFGSFMNNLLMTYQPFLLWYLMTTDITSVLLIVIIEIAAMCFHNSVRCSLVLEKVTGECVYLINAITGLIM